MKLRTNVSTFISYSWDSETHCMWVKSLATRLRSAGINVILDTWETVLGDQLPAFMEKSIRESQYVVIICTPPYKERSESCVGGVGFEGSIITAEMLYGQDDRKFIPVWRSGTWEDASPSWLRGKKHIDLSQNPYKEQRFQELKDALLEQREVAPPIGGSAADCPFSSNSYSRTWIPPSNRTRKSSPTEEMLPFPIFTEGDQRDNSAFWHLLVVVSDADQLENAREAMKRGRLVVIWALLLPERIALEAEKEFPVVYGPTSSDKVRDAYTRGPGVSPTTAAVADAEAAFGFPDELDEMMDQLRHRLDHSDDM